MQMSTSTVKRRSAGLVAIAIMVTVVAVLLGMYQKVFTPSVDVVVRADRAGLQLDKGAPVRAAGVTVGDVRDVAVRGDHVDITVALRPEDASKIPANTVASIRATTVFGTKFVDLDVAGSGSGATVSAGDVLQASSTTTEVNDVFAHAMDLMDVLEPEQLNSTLTAMATALEGRGEALGETITAADRYLEGFSPSIDQLGTDFSLAADVAGIFADVAPTFIDVAENFTTTSRTLVDNEAQLGQFLADVQPAAGTVADAIDSFAAPMAYTSKTLLGPLRLLDEYGPQLPCTLKQLAGIVRFRDVIGNKGPWLELSVFFLPGQDPYSNPEHLPKFSSGVGPLCLADVTDGTGFKRIRFDDGTKDIYDDSSELVDLNTRPIRTYEGLIEAFFGESAVGQLLGAGRTSEEGEQ